MKTAILLLGFLVVGVSSLAHAQAGTDADVVIVKANPKEIVEESSEHNRMGKMYELTLMPFGVGPRIGPSHGLNMAYRLDRNNSVVLQVARDSGATRRCSGDFSCQLEGRSLSLYYKQFVVNSFYYAAGLDLSRVSYEEEASSYRFGFEGDTVGIGVVIGNQWQWQNFTLGCDWIGWGYSVASKVTSELYEGSANRSWVDHEVSSLLKGSTGMALRFYAGASF